MKISTLFELKDKYLAALEAYTNKLKEATNPDIPIEKMIQLCRESNALKKKVDMAEYKYKQYIASINPEDLENLDPETFKKVMSVIILDCADFQRKIFMDIWKKFSLS